MPLCRPNSTSEAAKHSPSGSQVPISKATEWARLDSTGWLAVVLAGSVVAGDLSALAGDDAGIASCLAGSLYGLFSDPAGGEPSQLFLHAATYPNSAGSTGGRPATEPEESLEHRTRP